MTDVLSFALDLARQAGTLLAEYAGRDFAIGHKSSVIDLVTEADLASERLIVDAIHARFPQHAILAEEGLGDLKEAAGQVPVLWLVDPLDGTVNYAHRYPIWAVTLALAEDGQVTMGVAYDPLRDEMAWAERGRGAWLERSGARSRLHVSAQVTLQSALLATGFPYRRASTNDNNLPEFNAVMPRVQGVRRAGAAVLDLVHLAAGHLDGYWEKYLNPWDWAAGSLLVAEAGGRVSTLNGRPWTLADDTLLASNGLLHDELLAALGSA
jgi:myo-inositol-1(or 4)-monophosphatase